VKKIEAQTFIDSLQVKIPPIETFLKLGDMTALFINKKNQFVRLNYNRGPLLYGLISKYKPKTVLEFGTAGGFGTLCMAWAMEENNIPGKIFTIDIVPPDLKIKRPVDWSDGSGPKLEDISLNNLWKKAASPNWLKRIHIMTGYSGEIISKKILPKIDFVFLDGAHFYEGVKHDFYSFLQNSSSKFGALFDDYVARESFGIKKLIDDDISKTFDPILIDTDVERDLVKLGMVTNSDYGMCWIHSDSLKKPKTEILSNKDIDSFLKQYRRFEKRLKIRNKINEKIPLLKNIRFRWWKK